MSDQLILNRYRPIEEAGAGGFGTVQLAWDTRIQRRVAIKCMKLEATSAQNGRVYNEAASGAPAIIDVSDLPPSRIPGLEEARMAAMLSDASIVAVYDFEIQGDLAYLIMEYVDGMTLSSFLASYGDLLTLDMVAAIFSSIAHALETAHADQVLHLDVKPDNVLIDRKGQVKVTDFGLARLSDAAGFAHAGGGTIGYMPPEQMRQEALDARTDEWALASLTYEMLAGSNPFLARDLPAALSAIEGAELMLPSLCFEGLSTQVDDVVFYALDPDREERYSTVEDFAEEIEPFLGDAALGRKQLAGIVGEARLPEEGEGSMAGRLRLADRLGARARAIVMHAWGALSCALLGYVGISNIPQFGGWGGPASWGALTLIVLAGALAPQLGAILAVLVLGAALIVHQAYIVGALTILAGAVWWFFIGRHGSAQADAALSPVLFGSFGLGSIAPLASGFFLSLGQAVANAAFSALIALIVAGFGSLSLTAWNALGSWNLSSSMVEGNIVTMLSGYRTWIIMAGWVGAAAASAALCSVRKKGFPYIGMVAGGGILVFSVCLVAWLASGRTSWMPALGDIVPIAIATALMCLACLTGCPSRDDSAEGDGGEEDLVHRRLHRG